MKIICVSFVCKLTVTKKELCVALVLNRHTSPVPKKVTGSKGLTMRPVTSGTIAEIQQ